MASMVNSLTLLRFLSSSIISIALLPLSGHTLDLGPLAGDRDGVTAVRVRLDRRRTVIVEIAGVRVELVI